MDTTDIQGPAAAAVEGPEAGPTPEELAQAAWERELDLFEEAQRRIRMRDLHARIDYNYARAKRRIQERRNRT